MGRAEEAIEPLTTVIDEYPTRGGALYWLGVSYHTLGRSEEAKAYLQRAIDSDDVRYVEPATDLLATF
jgi:tetratricopeptide (TPR) repeat protein